MKKIALLILGLFLSQNLSALSEPSPADVEAFQQKMAKERPDTYARIMRAFGHHDVPMDSVTRSRYQKALAKEGPLTIEFILEKDLQASSVCVTKTVSDGTSLSLFKAKEKRSDHFGALKLETQEQTPFAQFEHDATGWQLSINDGVRNKFTAHISSSGNLTISSGQGMDTLEIKTSAPLTFTDASTFSKINLETNQVGNEGVLEVGTLSLKKFDGSSFFENKGYLRLADLQIDKCTFSNKNKVVGQKQLNLDFDNGEFVNDKGDTKTGVVEAETLNLTGAMGTFSNNGNLEVGAMQGVIHKLTNKGIIQIKSSEQGAVHLVGQTLENKANWHAAGDMNLQFRYIENGGAVTTPSLMLQSDGIIQNSIGAQLYANQIAINGKCYLTNEGIIFGEQQLKLKVSSTTNEGSLLAKDLIKIDNDGNYFKNTARGKIQTEGVLQIAATGPWWINEGQIIVNEVQSQGILFNIKSGNINSQHATLNGQLFNDATLTANELNARMQSIGGEGKLLMFNGQIKIDSNHAQLGQWSCSGKCDLTAPKFSIFGSIEGKTDNGQPAELTIISEDELWNGGNIYCAAGASCKTVSTGKTVNMPSSKIISDGSVKQQSTSGDVKQEGSVIGNGSYSADAPKGSVNNRGAIDVVGHVQLEAGQDVRNEKSIKSGSLEMKAGETVENMPGATTKTTDDTDAQGKNIKLNGKVDADEKFTGEAIQTLIIPGDITSGKGFRGKAGERIEIENTGKIVNKGGVVTFDAPTVINKGKILSKEDLEIFASKLFLNEGGTANIGRDANINADTVQNVSGRILVGHLLKIHAKKLENKRAPTIMKSGEDCPQPPLWEKIPGSHGFWGGGLYRYGSRTCQGDYEVETSDAAVISSMGDIVLDVGDGANIASTIYAKGDITITGSQFKNLAHNLKNYKLTKGWRHWETCRWWGLDCDDHYEPTTTVRNEPDYVGATLAADGKITVNGGLENTGNVKSGGDFNLVSEDETTKLINGLFDPYTKTAKAPEPKTGDFKIYEYLDSFGNLYYFRIASADEKDPNNDKKIQFILIPASEADQKTLDQQVGAVTRGLSERPQIAYLQKETKESPLDHRFVMHPQLAAQVVESMLVTQLGTSHLSGFENKTAMEQYLALETRGYQYAQKFTGNTNEDALPLSLDQIANAQESFIYYDLVKHEGEVGYAPVLHIAKEEAQKHVPETEGTIQASNIHIVTGDAKNTGTIKSTGDLKITAHTFENRRRDHRETEIVKEQSGFWGGTRTRIFEIRTPEIGGDIIGINVELTAEKNAVNEGGKIVGTQKVYLVSKGGNVEHKAFIGSHVVHLHQCALDKSSGKSSAEEALDYYPAELIGGDIGIDAKVGKVLVQASDIIGTGNVHISGQKEVTIEALMSKYKSSDSHSWFSGGSEETVVSLRSTITSTEGDVTIKSPQGSIKISASTVNALKGAVALEAKNNIILGTQSVQYTKSKTEAAGGLNIGSTTTEVIQTAIEQTIISALKGITMKAGEDNILEAVFMHSGGYIHIVAGRDNRFKGFEKKTDITTQGWNIGISFLGNDAMGTLMDGNNSDAIKSLRDSDPLISAINRLQHAQDTANKVGEGTHVAIEALRVLDQYLKTSSQPGATMGGTLGQRMGLTDAKGNFAPKITLHVGTFKSETHMTDVIRTALSAQGEVKITSERDTHLSDGTSVAGDRILITAQDVTMSSAQNRVHSESEIAGASVSYVGGSWSGGVSHSESHRDTMTNQNAQINGKTVEVQCKKLQITGGEIEGEDVTINVEKDFNLQSVQDTDHGSSTSVGVDSGGSASFAHETIDKDRVNIPSSVRASKSLKIKVGGTLYLIGGVVDGPKDATDIAADEVKVTQIHDHDDTSSFGVNVQFPTGSDPGANPIPAVFDIDHKEKTYSGTTQATISEGARLEVQKITDNLQNINRELDKVQIGSSDETHFRAVVPVLNLEQMQNDMHRLKELLGGDTGSKSYESAFQSEDSEDEITLEDIDWTEGKTQAQYDKSQESPKSADEKDTPVEKLKVVSTESVTMDDREVEVTTLDFVDADGKSLGKIHIGDFKGSSEKLQTHSTDDYPTSLFTDASGRQTLVTKSDDGHTYVLQGDASTLEKIVSLAADFTPYVGTGKGITEAVSGYDPITGESISRWISVPGVVLSVVPGGKLIPKGIAKAGSGISKLAKTISDTVKIEKHHFLTNKHFSYYTKKFEEIVNKYDLKLNGAWNKEIMEHGGRHAKQYHDWVLDGVKKIDELAKGSKEKFLELFEKNIAAEVRAKPEMLKKEFWLKQRG